MTNLLQDVIKNGTGWRAKALGRPCAGKTGTTNEYTDAWFVGYSPDLITGVWVGFDEKKSLGKFETGSRAACPIWVSYMKKVLDGKPGKDFPIPVSKFYTSEHQMEPFAGMYAKWIFGMEFL